MIRKTTKKTDKVDAEKIAQVLRMGMIPECYIQSMRVRDIRNMVWQHVRLMQARIRVVKQIHSLLDAHGEAIHVTNVYSQKALFYLDALCLDNDQDEFVLRQCTRRLRYYTSEITEIGKCLEVEAAQNEDAKLLTSMTDVGDIPCHIAGI